MIKHELDTRKLLCPLPVIRTQAKVKQCQVGDILVIYATDPGVKHDIPAWCRIHGHELQSIEERAHEIILTIKVCQ